MHDRDLCDRLALRGTSFPCSSSADLRRVPRLLSTAWSAKTVFSTDSQVVALLVRGFDFPAIPGCRHPSNTPVLLSSLRGTLPHVGWCSCSHDSKVATLSNVVVVLASLDLSMLNFLRPAGTTLVFSSRISLSSIIFFFLSCAHSSLSLRSLMLPLCTSSYNCLIPLPRSSRPVPTAVWDLFSVLLVSFLLDTVAPRFFLMVVWAHRTVGTRRSQSVRLSWYTLFIILRSFVNVSSRCICGVRHFSYHCV